MTLPDLLKQKDYSQILRHFSPNLHVRFSSEEITETLLKDNGFSEYCRKNTDLAKDILRHMIGDTSREGHHITRTVRWALGITED